MQERHAISVPLSEVPKVECLPCLTERLQCLGHVQDWGVRGHPTPSPKQADVRQ